MEYVYNDMLPLTATNSNLVPVDGCWVAFFLLLVAAWGMFLTLAGRREDVSP